jgi:hypothetical protein
MGHGDMGESRVGRNLSYVIRQEHQPEYRDHRTNDSQVPRLPQVVLRDRLLFSDQLGCGGNDEPKDL